MITFYGNTADELRREMATSIDDYLAFCDERGIEAAKPYAGRFNVRMESDVHRAVALAAASSGQSMNEWVVERLSEAAASVGDKAHKGRRTERSGSRSCRG